MINLLKKFNSSAIVIVDKKENAICCINCGNYQNDEPKIYNPCEQCDNHSEWTEKKIEKQMALTEEGNPIEEAKECINCAYGAWRRQKGRKKHSVCSDCVDCDEWQPMKKIKSEDY